MAGVADILRLLLVGGGSGAAGAGIGAMGASSGAPQPAIDPRIAAMRAMQSGGGQPVSMLDPAAREQAIQNEPLQARARQNMDSLQNPGLAAQNDPAYADARSVDAALTQEGRRQSAPMSTEEELAMAQKAMGSDGNDQEGDGDPDDNAPWEGAAKGVPTPADLAYLEKNGTDGVINDFNKTFPDWVSADMQQKGHNPDQSPDEYATDEADWQQMNRGRKTKIDER